jgi:hypothetical protein
MRVAEAAMGVRNMSCCRTAAPFTSCTGGSVTSADVERLRNSISTYDDRRLIAILTIESSTYRQEVIAVAEAELESRGVSEERLQEFRLYRQQQAETARTAEIDELRAHGVTPADLAATAERNVNIGMICVIGGIVVTVFTYISAVPGETFIVAWGAVIYGLGLGNL